ncbi:MAG: transporter substrate-binding domain-containing protein [Planctomycetota bacterium]
MPLTVRNCLLALSSLLLAVMSAAADSLNAGWYAGEPQQFRQSQGGRETLTGLDVEMVRAIAARAGHAVTFQAVPWPDLVKAIEAGTTDLAPGTAPTEERAARAVLSRRYRQDTNVLIVRRGEAGRIGAMDAAGFLVALSRDAGFRLGVRAGFSYLDPALDSFIADPAQAVRVRPGKDDAENLQRLLDREIDGFLAERLSVALLVSRSGARRAVEEAPLRMAVPLHLMFSRTVPAATVASFDRAIAELEAEGALARIEARFRMPALLGLTLGSDWFLVLEVLGTIFAALAGYLAARHERYSLFGALVLASIAALSGGVLRDLLIARHPIAIMTTPLYVLLVVGTVAGAYLAGRSWAFLSDRAPLARVVGWVRSRGIDRAAFEIADALGLSCFAVVGVAVAVGNAVGPLWLWGPTLGTLTGAGGGVLRDIVRGGGDIPNLRSSAYAEIALLWTAAMSLYLTWRSGSIEAGEMLALVVVVVIGGTLTRLGVVVFRVSPVRLP